MSSLSVLVAISVQTVNTHSQFILRTECEQLGVRRLGLRHGLERPLEGALLVRAHVQLGAEVQGADAEQALIHRV